MSGIFLRCLSNIRYKTDKTPALLELTFYNRWEEGRRGKINNNWIDYLVDWNVISVIKK